MTTPIPQIGDELSPEDLFIELFTQVFGLENARLLTPEFAVEDIYGGSRFIDFACGRSTSAWPSRSTA